MISWNGARGAACITLGLLCASGCTKSEGPAATTPATSNSAATPARKATAAAADVKAARARLNALGTKVKYAPKDGDLLTEIVVEDGSNLTPDDVALFGKLADLEKLQLFNFRALNDDTAAKLFGLKNLKTLALTNTVINDATVEAIVKALPNLVDLDLSSNTNMSSGVVKILSELGKLQRLTLMQNQVNDISAQRLSKLQDLRALDLRGNMEAGDLALEVVAALPKLAALKHRSTAVSDSGIEYLSKNQAVESLLLQDFVITDQSGQYLAQLPKLSQLEIFRCQGFGTEGVLALKGMKLTRLTLRDLPNIDDRAMEVFDDLPELRRLYLHELQSVGDSGLAHLGNCKSLELLDIWTVPQMTDATVDVIATLPNLKELSLRATDVTDAAIDQILKMPALQSLTFKENGRVTDDGLKKLAAKKWTKLDLGNSGSSDGGDGAAP
jgi:Leucine-rich repeat (LRR) protein